ncbi:MAG: PorT family protein [Chitinophagaceae bacterium]|nr:PorT family protein [Chitinophagaceae bacterium]
MKKVLVLVAAVVLVSAVQAQKGSVKFGVKAGANISMWGGDDADESKSKIGFNAGGLVNIPVSDMFSVQPEALFSIEGAKYDGSPDDASFNLSYINIPVLFQYNNPSGFYAETGPQIGLLMSAKLKVGDESEDYKEFFKGSNFSWAFGAGFKTKSGFGFGARYNFGLGNIADDEDADLKQSNLSFGLFYLFGGDKK